MWTYLLLFSSVAVVFIVFLRRVILHYRALKPVEAEEVEKETAQEVPGAEEEKKKRVSRGDKEKVEDLCARGKAMIKSGKDEEAVKCFVQALSLDTAHQETQHQLAMLYFNKQMFSAAAALFKELGDATQDAVHFSHLGLALYKQQDFEGALKAYQDSVSLDDTRPQRFVSLSQVYRALGQANNAIIALEKAIRMGPENHDFKFLMADILIEQGRHNDARVHIETVLVAAPEDEEAKNLIRKINKLEKEASAENTSNS